MSSGMPLWTTIPTKGPDLLERKDFIPRMKVSAAVPCLQLYRATGCLHRWRCNDESEALCKRPHGPGFRGQVSLSKRGSAGMYAQHFSHLSVVERSAYVPPHCIGRVQKRGCELSVWKCKERDLGSQNGTDRAEL